MDRVAFRAVYHLVINKDEMIKDPFRENLILYHVSMSIWCFFLYARYIIREKGAMEKDFCLGSAVY